MLALNGDLVFSTEGNHNPERCRDLMGEAAWKTLHIGFFEGPQRPKYWHELTGFVRIRSKDH
jgi:hypothetical protein